MKLDKELMKAFKTWGETNLIIFDEKQGKFFEIKSVARGLGKGIIFTIGNEVKK